jgi:hypothetical protein
MTNAPFAPDPVRTARDLVNRLLDRGYIKAARPVLDALVRGVATGSLLARRLGELEVEAARLQADGKKLDRNNPVLRALLSDFERELRRQRALLDAQAAALQQVGIDAAGPIARQLALPGVSDQILRVLGVQFNLPDPEAVAKVVEYTNKPTWQILLEQHEKGAIESVQQIAIRGIVGGQGPVTTAREIRRAVEGLPRSQAEGMMRTLQLTAYRDAHVLVGLANADIFESQIRIATLDARTCMACVALHGTELPLGERVDDHWRGRCTSVFVVKGRPRGVQKGEAWFATQGPDAQQAQMGQAAFKAWQAGEIQLRDFVHRETDPVFGPMVREESLKGMLGDAAKRFYLN